MSVMRLADGTEVMLGAVLARAGEGTIYEVADRDDRVVKVFHSDLKNLDVKQAKLRAMTASPPAGSVQSDGFVVLTWPLQVASGVDGAVGYVMPRIDTTNAVEIHSLSNPSNRLNPLPSAPQWTTNVTWRHLVNVAANLCLAVDTVHRVDAVIGDFQERNILVHDTTQVTLVDCDSMQFTSEDGQQFLCGVGRPEFTAPELGNGDLSITARVKASDHFTLAVHIHLLLMAGNHPFLRGEWAGGGEQPDAMTLAKSGQWAGGPGTALRTHPLAPPVTFLPNGIQQLFRRAFSDGARDPALRPSAAEWLQALKAMGIISCPRNHQIPTGTLNCPWCAIDDERAKRRRERSNPNTTQTIRLATPTRTPISPSSSRTAAAEARRRQIIIAAAITGAAIVFVIIAAVAVGTDHPSKLSQSTYSPTTSTYTPTTSSFTPTYTPTYTPPPPPPTVPSTYPPPDAQSYESVFQNAQVGECVNRQSGPAREDGTSDLTSFYLTDCGAPDATDRVIERTNDTNECHGNWASHGAPPSLIVLCLGRI